MASALMSVESLKKALKQIEDVDKNKLRSFKILIQELAEREKISLKLRR